MHAGLYSIVFGRQTEGVKAHGKQHVIPLHAAHTGYDLKSGVCLYMSDVHSRTARIREFDERVKFRLTARFLFVKCAEHSRLVPLVLPFFLYCQIIVFHDIPSAPVSLGAVGRYTRSHRYLFGIRVELVKIIKCACIARKHMHHYGTVIKHHP